MMNAPFPEPLLRCPSCNGNLASGSHTCPTCGAVLPLETALQNLQWSAEKKAADILRRFRDRPTYWASWVLAGTPFFIVPPLLAIGLVLTARERTEPNFAILAVATLNIIMSVIFWFAAKDFVFMTIFDAVQWLRTFQLPDRRGFIEAHDVSAMSL